MAEAFVCSVIQNALGNIFGDFVGGIFTSNSNPITIVRSCNNNVENLKQKVDELKLKMGTAQDYVNAVHRRGEEIGQELGHWLTSANNSIEAADKFVADAEEKAKKKCFFGLCLNPRCRYQLSKKAQENCEAIVHLVGKACGFDLSMSHIPAPQQEVGAPVKGFEHFFSRRDVLEKIIQALQSPSLVMIGVHGMPGVGKTMLVKEVKRKAEQDKLFDVVVMASVARNAVLKNIQDEIARGLGVDQLPNEITIPGAANLIKARLMEMKKVLIILDDIWAPGIDLEGLGIALRNEQKTNEETLAEKEHTRCKILLTSRDRNVLSVNMDVDTQNCFPVSQLNHEEGFELFKRITGDGVQSHEQQSTAIKIIEECGGLPLAITTIAKALRYKSPHQWRDALAKLQRPSSENFSGISANIYSAIEVSYFHLESEELQKTFLLCSLTAHRGNIQYLLRYGMGLGLFHGINTLEKAQDRVSTLIDRLKDSSLLLDGQGNTWFKMHDVARDVAKSIASRDLHLLALEDEDVPTDWLVGEAFKKCIWIDLWYPDKPSLPDDLECPQLTFFHLSTEDPSLTIPENFFKRMPRLRVLDLTGMHFSSLPSSIGGLTNLVTLCLDKSVLGDIGIVGQLKNLEILTLLESDIKELPREIGQLTQLKLLDLSDCSKLKIIPRYVLAGMSKLEELYMANSFDQWEVEENENQRNASLAELKHLKKLTALEVRIGNVQMIPKNLFSEKLKRYKIFIGDAWKNWDSSSESLRILKLHMDASINSDHSVKLLLKMNEELHLEELKGVKNVVDELNTEGFQDLKYLNVRNAPEVQHIIKSTVGVLFNAFPNLEVLFLQNLINFEKIFQGWFKETAFNKLRMLTVESCDKLKNLFSSSIARQLLQLREISVTECSNMEEIVDDGEQGSRNDIVEATDQLKFGEVLRSLRLERLPKFIGVKRSCRGMQLFNEQVVFPNLEELQFSGINVNTIWHPFITAPYVEKLTKLIIEGCDNLEYLFSFSMARGMVMLGHLEIKQCEKMREVLFMENVEDNGNLTFPQLRVLLIEKLPKLRMFCSGNYIKFPCLLRLTINSCPVLKTFISGSTFGHMTTTSEKAKNTCTPPLFDTKVTFSMLETLIIIQFMGGVNKIWDNQLDATSFCQVEFPNLVFLKLSSLAIQQIWPNQLHCAQNLVELCVLGCDNLKYLFISSMFKTFEKLQNLVICDCGTMEEAIGTDGLGEEERMYEMFFPKLDFLALKDLHKLTRFCYGNFVEFPCLTELYLINCPLLKTFISSSISEDMTASSEKAKNICVSPLFDKNVALPSVKEIGIHSLGSLNKIWHDQLNAEAFCQLNDLKVNSCEKLLNIFPLSMMGRLQRLNKLEIWNCDSLEDIFESRGLGACQSQSQSQVTTQSTMVEPTIKFVFSELTHLDLQILPKLKGFYCQMHTTEWPSLKKLVVRRCHQLQIFSSEFSRFQKTTRDDQLGIRIKYPFFLINKDTFPCLEELKLEWNDNMKEIWHGQYLEDFFPKLKILELIQFPEQSVVQPLFFQSLSNLEKLVVSEAPFHEIFQCQGLGGEENPALAFAQLSELRLSKLHELTNLWKEESHLKSVFYNLKTLEVQECSKLKNLVPSFISFKNLMTLEVSACHELINLVGYSTAKSMVQLTRMSISECKMIKEIVACLDDEVKDGIVFSQLKCFQLRGLPRLASFCSGNCSFKFASLEDVVVMGCPNMQIFSKGECNTPNKLQKVKLIVDEDEGFWEGNLNSTIQKMFREKVGYQGLENLKLSEFPELIEIWNKRPQEISPFKRLKSLEICNCSSLKYLLTPSMALGLVQLHNLKITNCAMMEQVITGEGVEEIFPLLDTIILEFCSNLTCFYEGSSRLKFSSLKRVTLVNCPILVTFATSFSREQGKEIIADDRGSEERLGIPIEPFFNDKVVLPNLEELQLRWMNVNIKWHTSITSLCVEKLKKLIIQGCDNLEFLFSSSIARGLVMLGQLEIRECKRIREIIVTDTVEEKENLIFPQLNFLLLKDLQNVVGFYSGNCIVEFPSLKQLQVLNCPELEGFIVKYFASTNVIAESHSFFNEQVAFPNLKSLTLTHLKNLDIIWHNQFHADSFGRLKSLVVGKCEKLSAVFSSADILGRIWKSLEKLIITDCGSLEVVFGIAEFNVKQTHTVIDTELRELIIGSLPRLKHVWNKDPEGILTFHKLESVEVKLCESLKIVFPASIGKSLFQLKRLHLYCCGVEEIVTVGKPEPEVVVNFKFPRVSSLTLEHLPRLHCFYPGKHTTKWPMLKAFYYSKFNQGKSTNGHGQLDFPAQLPLFFTKEVICQLEKLSLTRPDIAMICEHESKNDFVFNCKVLRIHDYLDDELDVLPIGFLKRFCHLEKLVVRYCNFKELLPSKDEIEEQEKWIDIETLSTIKRLKLESLPYLKHIWRDNSYRVLQNLESLVVSACEDLITLSTSTAPFQNINTLNITGCSAMVNLVSVSIAQSLVKLERMTVSDCYMLTEIVENEGDGTQDLIMITFAKLRFLTLECLSRLESFCLGNFTFKFPSLEKVIVNHCPKFKIFNKGGLNTPLLQRVELNEEEKKWRWASDLNTTIQKMYIEKVGYAGIPVLILSDFPEFVEKWHIKSPKAILDFRKLEVLEICDCNDFKFLLTPFMASSLVQLLQLIVKNCGTMEQVITGAGAENQIDFPHLWLIKLQFCSDLTSFYEGSHSLKIPALGDVIIRGCPKMVTFASILSGEYEKEPFDQYFFSGKVETSNLDILNLSSMNIQQIWHKSISEISSSIQNLRKLHVQGCDNLKYILTSSMLKSFEQLKWLEIRDCQMMEEVILMEESVDKERMYKIFFPNLEFLLLQDLPKLTRFCFGNYLELPCLWKLKISKCPVLKTFISSVIFGDMTTSFENAKNTCSLSLFDEKVVFPKLERLVIEYVKSLNKIWNDQLEADSFCQLTLVSVVSCEKVLNIFPFSMLERLQRLLKLQILNCDSLEEIFESKEPGINQSHAQKTTPLPLLETVTCLEDDVKDGIVFSKLKYLQLCDLPRLSSFCSVKCKFEFPHLEEVILMDCPSMQIFSMDEIRMPKLQKVKLTVDEDEGFWDGNLNSTIQLKFMQKSGGNSEN